jgi:hypothetical protein
MESSGNTSESATKSVQLVGKSGSPSAPFATDTVTFRDRFDEPEKILWYLRHNAP